MSVFTPVNEAQLLGLLKQYDIGALDAFSPISQGMENTNYFVTTIKDHNTRHWVLTLFEMLADTDISYFLDLVSRLNNHGLPVPVAIENRNGQALHTLNGKPAIIVPRLRGEHVHHPNAVHCHALGKSLAQIHTTTPASTASPAARDELLWTRELPGLSQGFSLQQQQLLDETLRDYQYAQNEFNNSLATGLVHGDLFRDNVLFEEDSISGIIDFYNARQDVLVYDMAITANDWCRTDQLTMDRGKLAAFLEGYNSVRQLSPVEKEASGIYLQLAALRFWLSRTRASLANTNSSLVIQKDPAEYENILRIIRMQPESNRF